ncbi:MAG: tautomerase family protein, partial [Selenomonadaceae bacterium]|nr:tautomerase family protein [Selenomonadaceae bacterium]
KEQKEKLIADLTRVASEDLGVAPEFFYVVINEHDLDNWGVGGKTLEQFLADKKK